MQLKINLDSKKILKSRFPPNNFVIRYPEKKQFERSCVDFIKTNINTLQCTYRLNNYI